MVLTLFHQLFQVSHDEMSLARWTENIQLLSNVFLPLLGRDINSCVLGTTSVSELPTAKQIRCFDFLQVFCWQLSPAVSSKPTLFLVFFLLTTYL